MTPLPIYTFLVNNIDYTEIYSNNLSKELNDIIFNLNNQSIYIPYFKNSFRNGDMFYLYGKKAKIVYDMFINKNPKILELICSTSDVPTIITKEGFIDAKTMPTFSDLKKCYSKTLVSAYDGEIEVKISCYDSNNLPIDASLFVNNNLFEISPNNFFTLSINNKEILNLNLKSNNNFYFDYTGIEVK